MFLCSLHYSEQIFNVRRQFLDFAYDLAVAPSRIMAIDCLVLCLVMSALRHIFILVETEKCSLA